MFLQWISFAEEDATKHVHISFSVRSDILDVKLFTDELGIKPSMAFSKGEKYLGKYKNINSGKIEKRWETRYTGIWRLSTKGVLECKSVEPHLLYLLDILEPKRNAIEKYLCDSKNYHIRFYIWWEPFDGHGSYRISKDSLRRMSVLSHDVEFGVVYHLEDEENQV